VATNNRELLVRYEEMSFGSIGNTHSPFRILTLDVCPTERDLKRVAGNRILVSKAISGLYTVSNAPIHHCKVSLPSKQSFNT
jgi:hypothetical protein